VVNLYSVKFLAWRYNACFKSNATCTRIACVMKITLRRLLLYTTTSTTTTFHCTQVTFCFSAVCVFFVCASNISGMAERICSKFIVKTCCVPRSYEFECQGQRSRSPGTKNALCSLITPGSGRNGTRLLQTTSRSSRRDHCVAVGGWWECTARQRAVYVW